MGMKAAIGPQYGETNMTKLTEFNYAAFDKATGYMTALAIVKNGKSIGRIVIKPGRDGASRLTAYAQVWGRPMVKGHATGYGYDKRGAALSNALMALSTFDDTQDIDAFEASLRLRIIGSDYDQFDTITRAIEQAGYQLMRAL